MDNKQYAENLRKLADFFEEHPDVPNLETNTFSIWTSFKQLPDVARNIGNAEKRVDEMYYILRKRIGDFTIDFFNSRDSVCEKVVVGKKIVPAMEIPAREAQIIPEHEEEVYEYHCPDALLGMAVKDKAAILDDDIPF